jgi:putative aminopeptidase FrvX
MPRVQHLLEELTNAYGPTGFEGPVREIMRRELAPLSNDIETDGVGSLIVRYEGTSGSPRVMLAAHMDELGMLVKYITPEGFVKFQTLGGWLDQGLINQRFVILTHKGTVQGVTGLKTPHVMSPEDRKKTPKREDMFIDVGATSDDDARERLGIRPGDPIAPDSKFTQLNGGSLYLGKAFDDRVGLGAMVEVMRQLNATPPPNTTFVVATVQEEVGLRGATTSSYKVRPDVGINLEAGVASDYPGTNSDEAQEKLGKGPGIFLHDSSMLPNIKLRDLVVSVAEEKSIPVQFELLSGYGEDGGEMQRSYEGIPTINIAVPVRYLHNHNGIIDRNDFDAVVELVSGVIRRLDEETVADLKSFG